MVCGTVAAGGAKIAGKSALRELLKTGIRTGIQTGVENAAQNAAMDAAKQTIRIDAGRQDGFSTSELATNAGIGAAAGGALGVASPFVGKAFNASKEAIQGLFGKEGSKAAGKAAPELVPTAKPTEPVPTESTPGLTSEQTPPGAKVEAEATVPATPKDGTPTEAATPKEDVPATKNDTDPKSPVTESQPEGGEALATQKPFRYRVRSV